MSLYDFARTTRNSLSAQYNYDLVWDADKIWGCACDSQYRNYGCSWRKCPSGDDPLTKGQVLFILISYLCNYLCVPA